MQTGYDLAPRLGLFAVSVAAAVFVATSAVAFP